MRHGQNDGSPAPLLWLLSALTITATVRHRYLLTWRITVDTYLRFQTRGSSANFCRRATASRSQPRLSDNHDTNFIFDAMRILATVQKTFRSVYISIAAPYVELCLIYGSVTEGTLAVNTRRSKMVVTWSRQQLGYTLMPLCTNADRQRKPVATYNFGK